MKVRVWLLVATMGAALTVTGCQSTRYVTPWWRIHGTYAPCLMAESGGGKGCTTSYRSEHRTARGWVDVPSESSHADAFCGETRIALDFTVVAREGRVADFRCSGERAPAPDDRSLLCVEIGKSEGVTVRAIDCDGHELWSTVLPDPQPPPAKAKPFAFYSELSFVGFAETAPVFQSKLVPEGRPTSCVAFVLDRREGAWRRLGEMSVSDNALYRCRAPEAWNGILRERIVDTRRR